MKAVLLALLGLVASFAVHGEDAATASAPGAKVEAEKPAAKFIVLLPEQVDGIWYWSFYTTESQHIVQSAVEKALVDAGLDVIDLATLKNFGRSGSLESLLNPATAAEKAREAGATFVITGNATAVHGGTSQAYGVPVARSVATLTAKLVRASDGKVLAVKESEANEGAQSVRSAGQAALKKAGKDLAAELVKAAKKATAAP